MTRRTPLLALAFLTVLLAWAPAGRADPVAPTVLTFIPHWVPQAQFAGFYVAYEQGFYAAHGIDLTILTGGPDWSVPEMLANGKADVGTLWLSTAMPCARWARPSSRRRSWCSALL
jgi:NitT/TauT family transport system substrate-binding protein